jgi:hypothetical protein
MEDTVAWVAMETGVKLGGGGRRALRGAEVGFTCCPKNGDLFSMIAVVSQWAGFKREKIILSGGVPSLIT